MSVYNPDKWCIVKIVGNSTHYRVFGSWSGGYLDGDSWRMNSGITRVGEDDNFYYVYGASGSCYNCHKESYGANGYGYAVLSQYESDSEGRFTVLNDIPDMLNMEWEL
jgi:hypothetical protein